MRFERTEGKQLNLKLRWAGSVDVGYFLSYIPEEEISARDEQEEPIVSRAELPDFLSLLASARTENGYDLSVIDEASSGDGPRNGGIRCDVSKGPCSCGAWH